MLEQTKDRHERTESLAWQRLKTRQITEPITRQRLALWHVPLRATQDVSTD